MSIPDQIGRWALGDIAEEKVTGKLYRVVGFITSPAVVFHEIIAEGSMRTERVEVAGCLNELNDLRLYRMTDEKSP